MPRDYTDFMATLRNIHSRPVRPPLTHSYRCCCDLADGKGYTIPSLSTARRLLQREAA